MLTRVFKALADETRLTIMGLVFRHGHLCVCEVEEILDITQSKASRHLRYLRDAGVLVDERDGLIVNYSLPETVPDEVSKILSAIRKLMEDFILPEAGPVLVQLRATRAGGPPRGQHEDHEAPSPGSITSPPPT